MSGEKSPHTIFLGSKPGEEAACSWDRDAIIAQVKKGRKELLDASSCTASWEKRRFQVGLPKVFGCETTSLE